MNKNNFVKYVDLLTVERVNSKTDEEEFVFMPKEDDKLAGIYTDKCNMKKYGEYVPVRKTVYEKLKRVANNLQKMDSNYMLVVVYGYRALEMQIKYFNEIYEKVKNNFSSEIELYEYIHEKIAVPKVAGHPTGGAVDIQIVDKRTGKPLNFGSNILDWDTIKCYYENDDLTTEEKNNRKLLRDIMMDEGFAPYDGEWWHFSYGDKEWAFYYGNGEALYNQIESDKVYKAVHD